MSPAPSATGRTALTVIGAVCAAGNCPTMYRTERGTLVVQGYSMSPSDAGIDVPDGESLVEIPAELLAIVMREAAAT